MLSFLYGCLFNGLPDQVRAGALDMQETFGNYKKLEIWNHETVNQAEKLTRGRMLN